MTPAALTFVALALSVPAAGDAPAPARDASAPAVSAARARALPTAARAVEVLDPRVERKSHPEALSRAFSAYYEYVGAHPGRVRNPYLYYVDYGLDNRTPRGYVFDMERLTVVEGPFTVAHGRGSAGTRNAVPTRFSNRSGSYQTSLGLYLTQETYTFRGTSGGRRYSAPGLRLEGVSGRFNDRARRRGVVAHGAPYVTANDAGRSEGCPAMEMDRARRLLPMIANGGMVYHFSPRDREWLMDGLWGREVGLRIAEDADG